MSSLIYIIRKNLKNTILDILKSPGRLVMWIITIAVLVGIIVMSLFLKTQRAPETIADIFWFTGIVFVFIALFVITSVAQGLAGGSAIFEMSDVNLLFVSPVNPRAILLYGVIKMAKTAFFMCFFILFQSATFANFGVGFDGVLLTLAGTILSIMALTTTTLVIYNKTNSRPKRKLAVKLTAFALFVPLIVYAIIQFSMGNSTVDAFEAVIKSPFLRFLPVAGWTASGITAIMSGQIAEGLCWLSANVVLMGAMLVYILLSNPDYYEDVLVATETAYERKRAITDGNYNMATASNKRVKVSKTGISGIGASTIFGRHMRESFRENRFGVLTLSSILIAIGAVVLAVLFGDISILLYSLPWAQIFLIGTGRGLKDLYSHYIYMIPESSFKKIVWSNMEVLTRTLIENVLMFAIAGAILRTNILYILIYIAVYTLFSYVLVGVNYAIMRFTGADVSAGMLLLIYYFAVIFVLVPGVAAAIVVGVLIKGTAGFMIGLLILSAWELLAGTVCFMLSKGVLHNCDMAMIKAVK